MTETTTKGQAMSVKQYIDKLTPAQVLQDEKVHQKFIRNYQAYQGASAAEAEGILERHTYHLEKMMADNEKLRLCTSFSIYGVLMDLSSSGLSLDPRDQMCYIIPRGFNVGTYQQKKWEQRMNLVISPYGELALRIKQGQIQGADNPVIVYQGDTFVPHIDGKGDKAIMYSAKIPRQSDIIIGSFIKLIKKDGTHDYHWMTTQDIERLKGYSTKQNQGNANELYTSGRGGQIDTGFLAAKTIRHAFKAYSRLQLAGKFSILEAEAETEAIVPAPDYDSEPFEGDGSQLPSAPGASHHQPEQNTGDDTIF